MTVAENLVLSRSRLPFVVNWRAERRALETFMAAMPFKVDLGAPVRTLAAGEKQKIEILKQLYLKSRIMILDEPTSVLTPAEADEILGLLHDMTRAGHLSIILITHKFREVMRFADDVTILRRGKLAGRGDVKTLTPDSMAEMMMGAGSTKEAATRNDAPAGDIRLRVDALSALDDAGTPALREISFDLRAGEIVGVAAVAGNGQEELVEVLAGQRAAQSGVVLVHGRSYEARRAQMREHNVRCLPEEPLRNACVPDMSVAENISFRDFDQPPHTVAGWGIRPSAIRESARRQIEAYGIRTRSPDTPIGELSGGNVQRAVLARELGGKVDVLIAANPCMGLDFAAVSEIHARIIDSRNRGAAVLLVSADLDEILSVADRILVMSEGRVVHETPVASADVGIIGRHMAGHS
jgi:simple sugar transport system ATP-binding protein